MSAQVAEVLRKALDKFGPNGEYWAQGWFAFDEKGYKVHSQSPCAVKWCSYGVCFVASPDENGSKALDVLFGLNPLLTSWNDIPERTFADVKALFEKAIAEAERAA